MDTTQLKQKINDLQKYIPHIIRVIEILQKDVSKKDKLNDIQLFHNLLTNPHKGATLTILKSCENILQKYIGQEDNTSVNLNSALFNSTTENKDNDISLLLIESKFIDEIKDKITSYECNSEKYEKPLENENVKEKENNFEKINKDQSHDRLTEKMNLSQVKLNEEIVNIDMNHQQSAQISTQESIENLKSKNNLENFNNGRKNELNLNEIKENPEIAINKDESNLEHKKKSLEAKNEKLNNDNDHEIVNENKSEIKTKLDNNDINLKTNTIIMEDSKNDMNECESKKLKLSKERSIDKKNSKFLMDDKVEIRSELSEASPKSEYENLYDDEFEIISESNSKFEESFEQLERDDDKLKSEVELIKYATEKLRNWDGNELTTDSESETEMKSLSEKSESVYDNDSISDSEPDEKMKSTIGRSEKMKKRGKENILNIEENCAGETNSKVEGKLNSVAKTTENFCEAETEKKTTRSKNVDHDESETKIEPELVILETRKSDILDSKEVKINPKSKEELGKVEDDCENKDAEVKQNTIVSNVGEEDKIKSFKEDAVIGVNEVNKKSNECDTVSMKNDKNENLDDKICNKSSNISSRNKNSVIAEVEQRKKFEESDNNQDPLFVDKEFEKTAIQNKTAFHEAEENVLSKLIVSDSDIDRLLKAQKLKNQQQKESLSSSSTLDIGNNIKKIGLPLKPPSAQKPAVVYLVKKDPSKSVETIELLDSDDENKYNDDDDVVLVSAHGLKKKKTSSKKIMKQNEAKINKITKSNRNSSSSSSFCTSSTPMFAISSVQSFGVPKPTTSGSAIKPTATVKNSLNKNDVKEILTEDEIESFSAIKKFPNISISKMSSGKVSNSNRYDNTINTVTIKKNGTSSTGSEYQATLRVCTPAKEPEALNAKDFLSAFQHFSAAKDKIKSFDSTVNNTNKITKRNSLSCQSTNDNSMNSDVIGRKSIDSVSSLSKSDIFNRNKDDQTSKDWLNTFITNLLSPAQVKSKYVLEILQKCLAPERYHQLKTIIDSHNNPNEVFSYIVSEKILKILPNGQTVETVQLVVKPINEVDIDNLNQEIRELFIKDGVPTEIGNKVCEIAQKGNKVLTTDGRNGQVTSRSHRMKHDREIDDEEYAPNVNVNVDQETTQERRRSLRRDNRINWKSYFTYDEEDDDVAIANQLKKSKVEKKITKITPKRPTSSKRLNGEPKVQVTSKRKKIKIEGGTSIQTPFDTDLLTPTWFESEDPEGNNSQSFTVTNNIDQHYDEISSYASSHTLDNSKKDEDITMKKNTETTTKEERISVSKNVNPAYHCRSRYVDACLICGEKVQHAVSHYVNEHPDHEVIISRITQRDVDFILQNVNYAFITNQKEGESVYGRAYQYTALCVFCKRDMKFALRYWWEHFTMHTGEYGYECTGCKAKRPRKQSTQVHINGQCKKRKKAKVKELYGFDRSITEIEAYICILCNYIQLHRNNVEKHLQTQHEMNTYDIGSHIARVSLIQFAKPYMEANDEEKSGNELINIERQQQEFMMSSDCNVLDNTTKEFIEYSNLMQSSDDLSFMICNMLASDNLEPLSGGNVPGNNDNLVKGKNK